MPPGTIEWRQGVKWAVLPPPYRDEDMMYLDNPLPGTKKFAVGKGSARKTLQVIGGVPQKDADVDMGWAQIHISAKTGKLDIMFGGGVEAANDRWALEELDRQSYEGIPEGTVESSRIPRTRPQPVLASAKEIYPEETNPMDAEERYRLMRKAMSEENEDNMIYIPSYFRRRKNVPVIESSQVMLPTKTYLGRKLRQTSVGTGI